MPTQVLVQDVFARLAAVDGKAEIVDGEIVDMPPPGGCPGYAGDAIFVSLWAYAQRTRHGRAVGDNKGFRVNLPHRSSFSPDAALYVGPPPGMGFYDGAPVFAVEVRTENDHGPAAEAAIAAKRADDGVAGTDVVWDVDLVSEEIRCYRASAPEVGVFRRGETADAEPAVSGWTFAVEGLTHQMPNRKKIVLVDG